MQPELQLIWQDNLRMGFPPDSAEVLSKITVGKDLWLDFLGKFYIDGYIKAGGSKVKLLIGGEGSGKTHYLYFIKHEALKRGYLASYIDASSIRLQHFNNLYTAIVNSVDIEGIIESYKNKVISELGYQPQDIPADVKFLDWTDQQGRIKEIVRRDIRIETEQLIGNKKIDSTFAIAIMQLCLDAFGVVSLADRGGGRDIILSWLKGEATDMRIMRRYHIFSRINKYNSRDMLRSILELGRLVGFGGLVVCIDHLEDLLARDAYTNRYKYSRIARDDAYESIRQLIDDIDNLEGILFVMASRPELLHDETRGVRSYEALWMRLQNEIVSEQFNKFSDIINLYLISDELLRAERLSEFQTNIASLCQEWGLINQSESDSGGMSISVSPRTIRDAVKGIMRKYRR